MPKLTSLGSGRLISKSLKLTTYTFPAGTSTWTAPTGVYRLTSASGKGADGTVPYWTELGAGYYPAVFYGFNLGGTAQGTSMTVGDIRSYSNSNFNSLISSLSGATSPATAKYATWPLIQFGWDGTQVTRSDSLYGGTYYTSGAGYNFYNSGYSDSTLLSSISSTQIYSQVYGIFEVNSSGTTGLSTTGFTKTFVGGNQTAASITTFTNVAVTPETQYSIVNYGSLTIQYYVYV